MNPDVKRILAPNLSDYITDFPTLVHSISMNIDRFLPSNSSFEKLKNLAKLRTYSSAYKKKVLQESKIQNSHLDALYDKMNRQLLQINCQNLMISDISGKCKPIIKKFSNLPTIHFPDSAEVQQDLRTYDSPFGNFQRYTTLQSIPYEPSETSSQFESQINILSDVENESKLTFCEHCQIHFKNPCLHRLTDSHQIRVHSLRHWKQIDDIITKSND